MLKIIKSPFIIIAAVCFAIAFLMLLKTPDVTKPSVKATKTKTTLAKVLPSPTKTAEGVHNQAVAVTLTPTMVPVTQAPASSQSNPTVVPTQRPTSAPAAQTLQVALVINGASVGNVTVDQGANQCDVLTKARDQGKISSLLMKYDNSLGTNGVYQINGQGKENSVWWVYKINGQSPGQGCSLVKVNNNDRAEWSYIGN